MSLGPIRSEIRSVALKRSAGAGMRVEKASNTAALPQETLCRRRRDYYTSATDTRRNLFHYETLQSDPIRYNQRLDAGFVAQVLGQMLPKDLVSKKPAYSEERKVSALLLDRSV